MKKIGMLTVAGSLVLAAGCAHHERARHETTTFSPTYEGTPATARTYEGTVVAPSSTTTEVTGTVAIPSTETSANTTTTVDTLGTHNSDVPPTAVNPNIVSPNPPRSRPADLVVQNEIVTAAPANDALISQCRQAINSDTALVSIAPSIQITARGGTVTLAGNVANQDQKQRIESLVRGTSGVVTVNNQLQVPLQPTGRSESSLIYSNAPQSQVAPPASATSAAIDASRTTSSADTTASATAATNQESSSVAVGGSSGALSGTNSAGTSSGAISKDQSIAAGTALSTTNSQVTTEQKDLTPTSDRGSTSRVYGTNQSSSDTLTGSSSADTNAVSPTSQSSTIAGQATTEQKDLTPTSERGSTNRLYSTNQSSSDSLSTQPTDRSQTVSVRGTTDADKQIGAQILQQLKSDASTVGLMRSSLRIQVENGKATLRGTVKSQDEKNKMEAVAKQVPGVNSVENQLRVGTGASSTDVNESK